MNKLRNLWCFVKHENNRDFALEVVKTLGIVLTGLGLLFSVWEGLENRRLTQERLITERFSKAVEQLKLENDPTVRIGGIYALERIVKDSDRDYWTIMDVLTSYVQEHYPIFPSETIDIPTIDLQAVLTVIGRREKPPEPRGISYFVNLSETDLAYAEFINANLDSANLEDSNLEGVNFQDANLKGANLKSAKLGGADFKGANLEDAQFIVAQLIEAHLKNADLEGTNFKRANLEDAKLDGADFKGANLEGANLKNARLINAQNLTPEQITSACYWRESIYKGKFDSEDGGIFKVDQKANQQHINKLEQKALVSERCK